MTEKKLKILIWIIAVIYIAVLLKITVFRADFLEHKLFSNGYLQYIPFLNYIHIMGDGRWLYFLYLFGGNIAWFMPLGFLLPILMRSCGTFAKILSSGFLLSLTIEFLQFVFGTGISELDDVILNTLGTMLGFVVYRIYAHNKTMTDSVDKGGRDDSQIRN